jgi:Domain of unknown function (DUF6471)
VQAPANLKAKMKEADITYAELAKRLKKHGLKETEAGITMKLKRGTFAATYFLACLAAMELEGVVLDEIYISSQSPLFTSAKSSTRLRRAVSCFESGTNGFLAKYWTSQLSINSPV